jgi:hypothetical protein
MMENVSSLMLVVIAEVLVYQDVQTQRLATTTQRQLAMMENVSSLMLVVTVVALEQ